MELKCQAAAVSELRRIAEQPHHSLLIDGCSGCGKTYLASLYAKFLGITDFHVVQPTVQEVRQSIDTCLSLSTPIVLCIENIDLGVLGAAYTLLKFLEEPRSIVFIVVTCRNLQRVPDTIVSRSVCISTSPPIDSDLDLYAKTMNASVYQKRKDLLLWRCVRTLTEVNSFLLMTDEQVNYIEEFRTKISFKDPVNWIAWTLSKFPDGRDIPLELSIRAIMELNRTNSYIQRCGILCIQDIASSRISTNAAVSKFLFECKYGS